MKTVQSAGKIQIPELSPLVPSPHWHPNVPVRSPDASPKERR